MAWFKRRLVAGFPRFGLHASGMPPPPADWLGAVPEVAITPDPDLERAVRTSIAARYGEACSPDDIVLTHGTSEALATVCAAVLRSGQTAVAEHPCYAALANVPALFGAERRRLPRRRRVRWEIDPDDVDEVVTPGVALVLVSSLHNPTGARLGEAGFTRLVDRAREVGALVLVDEVYRDFVFDERDRVPSVAAREPHVVAVSSLTKAWGLGALRVGWIVTHEAPELVERLRAAHDYLSVNVAGPSLALARAALARADDFAARVREIERTQWSIVADWLADEPLFEGHRPETGLITLVRPTSPRGRGVATRPFAEELHEREQVLVVPGTFFGAPATFRLGVGSPPDQLAEGLRRLSRGLRRWCDRHDDD